jgi:hypothetical protein
MPAAIVRFIVARFAPAGFAGKGFVALIIVLRCLGRRTRTPTWLAPGASLAPLRRSTVWIPVSGTIFKIVTMPGPVVWSVAKMMRVRRSPVAGKTIGPVLGRARRTIFCGVEPGPTFARLFGNVAGIRLMAVAAAGSVIAFVGRRTMIVRRATARPAGMVFAGMMVAGSGRAVMVAWPGRAMMVPVRSKLLDGGADLGALVGG